jgi:hypothetical protein
LVTDKGILDEKHYHSNVHTNALPGSAILPCMFQFLSKQL